jgi:methionyl-tRNA synthetase
MGIHESWYCMSDESFLTDTQVREAQDDSGNSFMVSKESGNRVEKLCEHNYKFKLSSFQDRLIEWLETNPNVIVPRSRYNEVNTLC